MRKNDVHELIAELRQHFDGVRAKAEFLKLKEEEFRPDCEISFFGFLQAKEHMAIEQSLLAGHAHMVQELVQQKHLRLDPEDARLLSEIRAYARRVSFL